MGKGKEDYLNRFKIRIENTEFNSTLNRLGDLYGGIIEADANLLSNEYWYYTNTDKETLKNSILIELVE